MTLNCKTADDVIKFVKDESIEYIDLRFTDPRGKWHHLTMCSDFVDEDAFVDGIMFDGSSIGGWKAINESDMTLIPDPSTAVMDPFAAQPMVIVFCDIIEPTTGQGYGRDPRSTAKKTEAYLKSTGIGDTAYFGQSQNSSCLTMFVSMLSLILAFMNSILKKAPMPAATQ